ncbi:hypothetical protein RHSIM_Rhsim02G0148700 [Rhododendron simsii]|uniref:Thymidine kinase n=1 Tax=Rhododendron simsii TaxID=118357 RepID=A0A834LZ28_RHOSS|nr:hypothetical protein RHSIM_Rhsim02G0148700 [Rhododendron simsii]
MKEEDLKRLNEVAEMDKEKMKKKMDKLWRMNHEVKKKNEMMWKCNVLCMFHICFTSNDSGCISTIRLFPSDRVFVAEEALVQCLIFIPLVDSITKPTAQCELCGKRDLFTLWKIGETKMKLISGSDVYMLVCRQHYDNGQVVVEAVQNVLKPYSKAQSDSYMEEVIVV